eukprot:2266342-Alexandrium_andersonii.AAC.1
MRARLRDCPDLESKVRDLKPTIEGPLPRRPLKQDSRSADADLESKVRGTTGPARHVRQAAVARHAHK